MALRQWLNPVAAIKAETNWPDDLCERFVAPRTSIVETGALIALGASLAAMALFWLAVKVGWITESETTRQVWVALALGPVVIGLVDLLAMMIRRVAVGRRALRTLPRFLEAPWCLKCHYPIGAVADQCVRCPECGYRIRWQIAELSEETGEDAAT